MDCKVSYFIDLTLKDLFKFFNLLLNYYDFKQLYFF